ncbi:kinase-like domain-containing protein [Hypoxylon argillaceum]|nr:kinase-like domain-containing protein [Hypoxylon argillaceum]
MEPDELPTYARVEDIRRYCKGGFHPIHFGECIDQGGRFEVHHKLGYTETCTVWLCLDRKNKRRVGVKVFQAEKSTETHPEIVALRLFEGINRRELQSNYIFPIEEHFWVDGPNGRHLCFVVQVLGPPISHSLRGIDLDASDHLADLCLQAGKGLKYLHDKKICHGDFGSDHMRMQLDFRAMRDVNIYDLFGEPKIWRLNTSRDLNGREPWYLAEPADIARLEAQYRKGKIAIDSFSASYRVGEATEPQIFDTNYAAPEVLFLNKYCGFSSDIWSLASTIHLVRTSKLLAARLDSRSSFVSWLAWAYGPFPQDYWTAIGEYLSNDSAVPVFTANPLPQKPRTKTNPYPREWGANRGTVVALLLGDEETPQSIQHRESLQEEKDRSKYLRIKLPKNSDVWTKFQEQRKRLTGFHSLLHEDLSKERQWYQDTDPLKAKPDDMREKFLCGIGDDNLRRLNGAWILESSSGPDVAKAVNKGKNSNRKRALTEHQGAQPTPKKAKTFVATLNPRYQVERTNQADGMTKFSYRLQPEEVDLLASLLRSMLKNDPGQRSTIDEVLQHKWFDASRTRLK